jgi:hypothetical protein
MHMNGHRGPVPPPDHTSILVDMSGRIGRLEGAVTYTAKAVDRIERRLHSPPAPTRDWLHYLLGALILGSAAAGKVTWQDALPSLLGLFGR